MLQPYAESPLCPNCKKPLIKSSRVHEINPYHPPTKHQCRRCKVAVVCWILLIKHETRDQLRVILPLNHIDFDTVPDEAYKSGLYDERVLLVLTSEELMRETDGSGSITVDDIFGLYESVLRAQMVN